MSELITFELDGQKVTANLGCRKRSGHDDSVFMPCGSRQLYSRRELPGLYGGNRR